MQEKILSPYDRRIIVMSADELMNVLEEFVAKLPKQITVEKKPDEDELIGTAEACKILGCSSRTMQRYRDSKLFNITMRGPHKALYYRSEILAFRNNNIRKAV